MRIRHRLTILTCIFVVLFSGLVCARRLSEARGAIQKQEARVLTTVTGETLSKVTYVYNQKETTLSYDRGEWRCEDYPELDLNREILDRIYEIVTGLTASRTLTKYAAKEDYGISSASVRVTVESSDKQSYTFAIGSYFSVSDGYYVSLLGDENLYFVEGEIRKPFTYSRMNLVQTEALPVLQEIYEFSVERDGQRFAAARGEAYGEWYSLIEDEKVRLNPLGIRAITGPLSRLKWYGCENTCADETDLAAYGLDKPAVIQIGYMSEDEQRENLTIYVGNKTGSWYYAQAFEPQKVMLVHQDYLTLCLEAEIEGLIEQKSLYFH